MSLLYGLLLHVSNSISRIRSGAWLSTGRVSHCQAGGIMTRAQSIVAHIHAHQG